MYNWKRILITILIISIPTLLFADDYYEDDEDISLADSGKMALIGGGIALVGYMIMQVKFIQGLGKVIFGIGAFIGGISILAFIMKLLTIILAAALGIAFKIAIVAGVGYLLYLIGRSIYQWFNKANN